jgi:glutathione S-transferase
MVSFATHKIYGQNLVVEYFPGIEAYFKMIKRRPYAQKIVDDRTATLAAKLQNK